MFLFFLFLTIILKNNDKGQKHVVTNCFEEYLMSVFKDIINRCNKNILEKAWWKQIPNMRHNLWYAGITVVSRALHYCSWMEVEIWHLQDTANLWIELYSKMFFLDEFAICNMMLNIKGLAPELLQIRENICHIGWEKLFFCVITCCVTIACFRRYNINCYLTIRIKNRFINVNLIQEW